MIYAMIHLCYYLGPIYRFVLYEIKTKRLVRVDALKQIRKPKTRFDQNGYSLQRIPTMTLTSYVKILRSEP